MCLVYVGVHRCACVRVCPFLNAIGMQSRIWTQDNGIQLNVLLCICSLVMIKSYIHIFSCKKYYYITIYNNNNRLTVTLGSEFLHKKVIMSDLNCCSNEHLSTAPCYFLLSFSYYCSFYYISMLLLRWRYSNNPRIEAKMY